MVSMHVQTSCLVGKDVGIWSGNLINGSDQTMRTLNYHQDPGHGWLEVTASDLIDVSLRGEDFTRYSYRSAVADCL